MFQTRRIWCFYITKYQDLRCAVFSYTGVSKTEDSRNFILDKGRIHGRRPSESVRDRTSIVRKTREYSRRKTRIETHRQRHRVT